MLLQLVTISTVDQARSQKMAKKFTVTTSLSNELQGDNQCQTGGVCFQMPGRNYHISRILHTGFQAGVQPTMQSPIHDSVGRAVFVMQGKKDK